MVQVAYLVQGGQVTRIEHDAAVVWIDEDLVEPMGFDPTYDEVQAWIDEPAKGLQVADMKDLLEAEDEETPSRGPWGKEGKQPSERELADADAEAARKV